MTNCWAHVLGLSQHYERKTANLIQRWWLYSGTKSAEEGGGVSTVAQEPQCQGLS